MHLLHYKYFDLATLRITSITLKNTRGLKITELDRKFYGIEIFFRVEKGWKIAFILCLNFLWDFFGNKKIWKFVCFFLNKNYFLQNLINIFENRKNFTIFKFVQWWNWKPFFEHFLKSFQSLFESHFFQAIME